MRTTYLLYARTGCELAVGEELEGMGISAWVARVIAWERKPTKRRAQPVERPAWPNYLFADLTPHDYHKAASVRDLTPYFQPLPDRYRRELARDRERVDAEYAEQMRKVRRQDLLRAEYVPGEMVRFSGPLGEVMARFKRVVERGDERGEGIRYQLEAEMMGQSVTVYADPLELRKAV